MGGAGEGTTRGGGGEAVGHQPRHQCSGLGVGRGDWPPSRAHLLPAGQAGGNVLRPAQGWVTVQEGGMQAVHLAGLSGVSHPPLRATVRTHHAPCCVNGITCLANERSSWLGVRMSARPCASLSRRDYVTVALALACCFAGSLPTPTSSTARATATTPWACGRVGGGGGASGLRVVQRRWEAPTPAPGTGRLRAWHTRTCTWCAHLCLQPCTAAPKQSRARP